MALLDHPDAQALLGDATLSVEKLMTYALGRGLEYQDMPLVRSIARASAQQENRLSALVLAIVRSAPFQTNTKMETAGGI